MRFRAVLALLLLASFVSAWGNQEEYDFNTDPDYVDHLMANTRKAEQDGWIHDEDEDDLSPEYHSLGAIPDFDAPQSDVEDFAPSFLSEKDSQIRIKSEHGDITTHSKLAVIEEHEHHHLHVLKHPLGDRKPSLSDYLTPGEKFDMGKESVSDSDSDAATVNVGHDVDPNIFSLSDSGVLRVSSELFHSKNIEVGTIINCKHGIFKITKIVKDNVLPMYELECQLGTLTDAIKDAEFKAVASNINFDEIEDDNGDSEKLTAPTTAEMRKIQDEILDMQRAEYDEEFDSLQNDLLDSVNENILNDDDGPAKVEDIEMAKKVAKNIRTKLNLALNHVRNAVDSETDINGMHRSAKKHLNAQKQIMDRVRRAMSRAENVKDFEKDKFFGKIFRAAKRFGRKVYRGAKRGVRTIYRAGKRVVRRVVRKVKRVARRVYRQVKCFVRQAYRAVKRVARRAWRAVKKYAKKVVAVVKKTIKKVATFVSKVASKVANFVKKLLTVKFGYHGKILTISHEWRDKTIFYIKKTGGSRKKKFGIIPGKKSGSLWGIEVLAKITKVGFSITPGLTIKGQIKSFRLKYFKATMWSNFRFWLHILVRITAMYEYKKIKELTSKFKMITFTVGPVPVWIQINFKVEVGAVIRADGYAQVTYGFEKCFQFEVGAEYNGKWKPILNKSSTTLKFGPKLNLCVNAFAEAFLRPTLSAWLYSTAGPSFELEPYINFEFTGNGRKKCNKCRNGQTNCKPIGKALIADQPMEEDSDSESESDEEYEKLDQEAHEIEDSFYGRRISLRIPTFAVPRNSSYKYIGCYKDRGARALPVYLGNNKTLAQCGALAKARGLKYFGRQWSNRSCFGGNNGYNRYGAGRMVGSGWAQHTCHKQNGAFIGGAWANAVYQVGFAKFFSQYGRRLGSLTKAVSSITRSVSKVIQNVVRKVKFPSLKHIYIGCYKDKGVRAMPVYLGDKKTLAQCAVLAHKAKLKYFGRQWSSRARFGGNSSYNRYGHGRIVGSGWAQHTCHLQKGTFIGGAWSNAVYKIKVMGWSESKTTGKNRHQARQGGAFSTKIPRRPATKASKSHDSYWEIRLGLRSHVSMDLTLAGKITLLTFRRRLFDKSIRLAHGCVNLKKLSCLKKDPKNPFARKQARQYGRRTRSVFKSGVKTLKLVAKTIKKSPKIFKKNAKILKKNAKKLKKSAKKQIRKSAKILKKGAKKWEKKMKKATRSFKKGVRKFKKFSRRRLLKLFLAKVLKIAGSKRNIKLSEIRRLVYKMSNAPFAGIPRWKDRKQVEKGIKKMAKKIASKSFRKAKVAASKAASRWSKNKRGKYRKIVKPMIKMAKKKSIKMGMKIYNKAIKKIVFKKRVCKCPGGVTLGQLKQARFVRKVMKLNENVMQAPVLSRLSRLKNQVKRMEKLGKHCKRLTSSAIRFPGAASLHKLCKEAVVKVKRANKNSCVLKTKFKTLTGNLMKKAEKKMGVRNLVVMGSMAKNGSRLSQAGCNCKWVKKYLKKEG